jgi:cell division GTPase FtsZ
MSNLLKDIINNLHIDGATNTSPESKPAASTSLFDNFDDMEEIGNFKIKIFGIGGAGCNVVDYMLNENT